MKIAILNHSDTVGGASVVAFRLMEAMRAEGIDARMLVGSKRSESPFVVQATSSLRTRIPFYREHLDIFFHNGFSRSRLFRVSTGRFGLPLSRHPIVRQADVVILNWVNQGFLSIQEISEIAQMKPTIWVMHDQWPFTSICHHTDGCDRFTRSCSDCHFLGSMASTNDLSTKVFAEKKRFLDNLNITYVAVSQWLADRARKSTLLKTKPIEVIPNAMPVERFAAPPRFSRQELGLPSDGRIILFAAARIDDPAKGLDDAINLLNSLNEKDILAVFAGNLRNQNRLDALRVPHRWIGAVDSNKIPSLMSYATVVLSTSPFETLSTTLIEAQAAGATPVGYTHDGRADIIIDGISGYSLGTLHDPNHDGIHRALKNPIPNDALRSYASNYSSSYIAQKYINLCTKLYKTRT